MTQVLDAEAVATGLATLGGWSGDTDSITRTVELASFPTAIRVVGEVGDAAEAMDHHPDIDIRWRTLTFTCSTHSAGGVTGRDLELAASIDRILRSVGG